ncbi:uncharacterized protein LOC132554085 [Ylistrum balloti]|uniref:uncharacterized protein LOC132554085 n=1 Tax=Ylistrum balloti TaxID=509963 RepID=UPI002905F0CD|nr:uncharacterized protein LOC132554085 [Ylistrum balloti]
MLSLCILIFLPLGIVEGVVNCYGKADGNYEITCHDYTRCHNGLGTHITCPSSQFYNPANERCDTNIHIPCSIQRDCSGMADKRYADLETHCKSYYTCANGYFLGHNFCNPGLVYDEAMQLCNWPVNVVAPCGGASVVG